MAEKIVKQASEKQVFSLLGLCARQGAVKSGEFLAEEAIRARQAAIVIVATDASENTKKNFKDACAFYNVPYRIFGDKNSIGHSIGREFRASLAVTNAGLAQKILKTIDDLAEAGNQMPAEEGK